MATAPKKKISHSDRLQNMLDRAIGAAPQLEVVAPPAPPVSSGAPPIPAAGFQAPSPATTGASAMFDELLGHTKESPEQAARAGKLRDLPIDLVDPDPNQPRKTIDEEPMEDLIRTVKAQGIIQPPVVRPHPAVAGRFMIVTGERRWRAAKAAGQTTIEVKVEQWDDVRTLVAQLLENLETTRINVRPWEEARTYQRLLLMIGGSREALCEKVGIRKDFLSKRLTLLEMPDEIGELMDKHILSDHETALVLTRLWNENEEKAREVIAEGQKAGKMPRSMVQDALRQSGRKHQRMPRVRQQDPAIKDASLRFKRALEVVVAGKAGLRSLKGRYGGGCVAEIEFSTMEELEALTQALLARARSEA